jgi:hypothetical protein
MFPSLVPIFAEVTLPVTGVDVDDFITVGITALGVVVLSAVGGYVAFLVIKKALGWLGRALGGGAR